MTDKKEAPLSAGVSADRLYAESLVRFETFYHQLFACSLILAAAILAIAFLRSIPVALIATACLCLFYQYFLSRELREKLGLSCRSVPGGLSVSLTAAPTGEEAWIPGRLLWTDVTTLRAGSARELPIRILHLPATLACIEANALDACPDLETLAFAGSREEFDAISSGCELSRYTLLFEIPYPAKPPKGADLNRTAPGAGTDVPADNGDSFSGFEESESTPAPDAEAPAPSAGEKTPEPTEKP